MTRNLAFLIFLVAVIAIGMRYVHRTPEAPAVQKSPVINDDVGPQGPPHPEVIYIPKHPVPSEVIHSALLHQILHGSPFVNVFLSVRDRDPEPALLDLLQDIHPAVHRRSDSDAGPPRAAPITHVKDRKTGERGLLLDLTEPEWMSEDEVAVYVSIQGGIEGDASATSYRLRRTSTGWRVSGQMSRSVLQK